MSRVSALAVRHKPFVVLKHPLANTIPFAKVLVAVVEVMLRTVD